MKSIAYMVVQPFLLGKLYAESLITTVRWIIVTLFTYIRIRRFAAKFPAGRTAWPLVGDMHVSLVMDEPGLLRYLIDFSTKSTCGIIWIGIVPVFYVWDPRDVERVLCNEKSQRKTFLYKFLEPIFGKGLITSSGEIWQRHSKIISAAFHTKILESFVPIFNRHVDVFVDILRQTEDGLILDILPVAERLTLDIICETAMGVNMKIQTGSADEYLDAIVTAVTCSVGRMLRPWLHSDWLYAMSSMSKRQEAARRVVHGVRDKVIRERKKILLASGDLTTTEDGKKQRLAFLDHLLLSVKAGAQLTDQEIADEVDTFMAAGADTASILLSYTLFELARYPNVQDKVLEELHSLYDSSLPTIDIRSEDLGRLTYLEMVLKETLRLHPPAPLVARTTEADIPLATRDLVIPAHALVAVPVVTTHRSCDYYSDPEKFDPERFSVENSRGRNPYAFLPFSAGRRVCIGRRLAIMEAKVAVAKTLWHYTFSPDPSFEPTDFWGISMKPTNGMRLKIHKRK